MEKYSFSFPGTQKALEISDHIFCRVIDTLDVDVAQRQRLKLILSELYMNAYIHGCKGDSHKQIDVTMEITEDQFSTVVHDPGDGLSEKQFYELVNAKADFESDSGRGIRIVFKLSDMVRLFRDQAGKFCVESSKKLNKNPIKI
jgi:anti-sigma regulatory factor (Ser/Thr protein kinase)